MDIIITNIKIINIINYIQLNQCILYLYILNKYYFILNKIFILNLNSKNEFTIFQKYPHSTPGETTIL